VLKGVTPDMHIFHEESFGPVTSIIKVKDHNEALEIANDTSYGLSSGVITNDMQKALDFAFKLDAGMVHINDCTVADEPHVQRRQEQRLRTRRRTFLDGGNDGSEVDHDAVGTARLPDLK
jgi:acyl-CoA reductase-like NAD-dependent aldehyde dehydrogenase